jgi:hypothetical protein
LIDHHSEEYYKAQLIGSKNYMKLSPSYKFIDYFTKIFTVEAKPLSFCESENLQLAFRQFREEGITKLPCVETVRKQILEVHNKHKVMMARQKFRFSSINFDIWTMFSLSFLIVTGIVIFYYYPLNNITVGNKMQQKFTGIDSVCLGLIGMFGKRHTGTNMKEMINQMKNYYNCSTLLHMGDHASSVQKGIRELENRDLNNQDSICNCHELNTTLLDTASSSEVLLGDFEKANDLSLCLRVQAVSQAWVEYFKTTSTKSPFKVYVKTR